MRFAKFICAAGLFFMASAAAIAQEEKDRGNLSVGFETNSYYYIEDKANNSKVPDGRFGSNDYLKLDYSIKGFSVGFQADAFLPPAMGMFNDKFYGQNVHRTDFYAAFQDKGWDVRVGTLFEQFGSGLLFRTYEDRNLGINNALQGVKVGYTFGDYLSINALYGRIRNYMEYSNNTVAGADLVFSLSRVLKSDLFDLSIEGSFMDKYEDASDQDIQLGAKMHTKGYSARVAFGIAGFTLKGEYMSRGVDGAYYNHYDTTHRSEAIQLELGYSGDGFGALLSLRKLQNPFLQGVRSESDMYTYINYVPSLTQQHTYALATMNPYAAQDDELGGQLDVYYNFKRNTLMGGRKGMKVHANFSTYYGGIYSIYTGTRGASQRLFQDLTLDVERWFGKDVKMILFYSWQNINAASLGKENEYWDSHTVVADVTYKITRKQSLRLELQHLYTEQDHKSWAAALLEYNIAPRWSITVQDMWNYGESKRHYFNGSVSYSYSKVRAALNFGRFKEGYLCSGGVCRMTPAYTGANLSLVITL